MANPNIWIIVRRLARLADLFEEQARQARDDDTALDWESFFDEVARLLPKPEHQSIANELRNARNNAEVAEWGAAAFHVRQAHRRLTGYFTSCGR